MSTSVIDHMSNWLGVSDSHIKWLDEGHGLHPQVFDAFKQMQKQAHTDGVDLQIASSFRSFSKQVSIWDRKWTGQLPILSLDNQVIRSQDLSEYEKMHAILLWSALPGASRHHWGTDLDVFDKDSIKNSGHQYRMVAAEYQGQGPCAKLSQWLDKHANTFGFYRPYDRYVGGVGAEPWHISHYQQANKIADQYQKTALFELLSKSEIAGKHVILEYFDSLYMRYVLNRGSALT